jgi:O-antigen/teichoic acid export membrane protein
VGISIAGVVGKLRPGPLQRRLATVAAVADAVLTGRDDRSVSQRIALYAFATRVVSAVIALASQALMARWMGDHEYGIFVFVWVAAVIVGGLACLGFQMSVVRFIPEYQERGENGLLRGIIVGARLHGLATATVLALIGAAGLWLAGDVVSHYYVVPFYLALICLPMLAVGEIQDGMARAFTWAGLALGPTFIWRPLLILGFMWVGVMLGYPADAVTAMGATIAAVYAVTVMQALALRRRIRVTVPSGPRAYRPLAWVAVSMPIFLVEGFFNLLTNVDILIVGAYLEPQQVAIYFATAKTLALVHFVYFAVRASAANRFSQYHVAGDQDRLNAFIRDTLHWTFWPSLAVSVLLLVFGWPLLYLFGPSFTAGYPLLFIFIIGLIARASVGVAESLLSMAGQQRICAAVYTAVFVLNVALNVLLVPRFGLAGAAMATATALVVEAGALFVVTRQRLGVNSWIGFAMKPAPATGAAA